MPVEPVFADPDRHPTGALRIGDRDRAEAAERLSAHAAAGRLTLDELEERLERVQGAVVARDLLSLEADLPGPPASPRRGPRGGVVWPIGLVVAAVLATVLVGHPVALVLIAAALVRRVGLRGACRQRRPGAWASTSATG